MFLKVLVGLIFISFNVSAETLKVSYGNKSYDLEFNSSKIKYQSEQVELTLSKDECNAKLVGRFNRRLTKALHSNSSQLSPIKNGINYILNNKQRYDFISSMRAAYLKQLPSEIRNLKINEKFKCN